MATLLSDSLRSDERCFGDLIFESFDLCLQVLDVGMFVGVDPLRVEEPLADIGERFGEIRGLQRRRARPPVVPSVLPAKQCDALVRRRLRLEVVGEFEVEPIESAQIRVELLGQGTHALTAKQLPSCFSCSLTSRRIRSSSRSRN